MKNLYEEVLACEKRYVFTQGPTGIGKTTCRDDQKLFLLVDLLSIAEFPKDTRSLFDMFIRISFYRVVFAESSFFQLYTRLQPRKAKDWNSCLAKLPILK